MLPGGGGADGSDMDTNLARPATAHPDGFTRRHLGYDARTVAFVTGIFVVSEGIVAGGMPPFDNLVAGSLVLFGTWSAGIRWARRAKQQLHQSPDRPRIHPA